MKFGQWWEIREAGTNMLKSAEDQSDARSEDDKIVARGT
jgi:hypothetical protein